MDLTCRLLDERIAAGDFPTLTALGAAGAFDYPDSGGDYMVQRAIDEFEFGLERILDGIESRSCALRRRTTRRRRSRCDRRWTGWPSSLWHCHQPMGVYRTIRSPWHPSVAGAVGTSRPMGVYLTIRSPWHPSVAA